ncbi:MAG TPA: hypothetical protein VNL14_17265 [Candidatus Acidoferrales bacterium]|nr:hypothetical protein [Candidatus Acidoferrales bacterium]
MEGLLQRIERLERSNRTIKALATMVFLAMTGALLMGQARRASQEVRAQKFTLVDAQGLARAVLLTTPKGEVLLSLNDKVKTREARLVLGTGSDGLPFVTLRDKDEKLRVMLGFQGGTPHAALYSADGKERAWLSVEKDGSPLIGLRDREGRARSLLTVGSDDTPRLALAGKEGKPRFVIGGTAEQYGFAFFDPSGKVRAQLETKADGAPSLVFADREEKVFWRAP